MGIEKQDSSFKNEEAIKRLELYKGRKIRLVDVEEIEKNPNKKLVGLIGVLGENMKIGEPIILTGGGHENRTKEVRNISFENGECRVQIHDDVEHKDVIYKLEVL